MNERQRITVLGAGFAGLETAFLLRMRERLDVGPTSPRDRPVAVRPDADGDYKVGTGATWRLGKKMLGATVPMRFHAGEPFHAGLAWRSV